MPHFIIDCSENILKLTSPNEIMQTVYDSSESTGLFTKADTKVRINPYIHYNIGNTKDDFIHVFAYILEGRSITQKSMLSKTILKKLKELFPDVPVISMNVADFEKESYCNKSMV